MTGSAGHIQNIISGPFNHGIRGHNSEFRRLRVKAFFPRFKSVWPVK
jgi:hypothetical protein